MSEIPSVGASFFQQIELRNSFVVLDHEAADGLQQLTSFVEAADPSLLPALGFLFLVEEENEFQYPAYCTEGQTEDEQGGLFSYSLFLNRCVE